MMPERTLFFCDFPENENLSGKSLTSLLNSEKIAAAPEFVPVPAFYSYSCSYVLDIASSARVVV